ncbi:MAG: Holliday junction resolvase RuvX [Halofilum sp. (in: g-proteobacteria)]|nr:Holliday junction resolvase RuvX [Halofilum sp. (in: g-proteobacteria)]
MAETFLGFDFGLRRIGVAAGQRVTASANPVATVPAREGDPDWDQVDALVTEWRPGGLVVGIPLLTDGREQPLGRRARRFAAALRERYGLPVHEADERLSSRAARELIAERRAAGARRRTRKGDVDRIAATLILEHWLQADAPDVD